MSEPGYESITPGELKERFDAGEAEERPRLLDVRQPWEFALSRIEGSLLAPPEKLEEVVSDLDRREEIVVVCHHGVRSAHVVRALQKVGFEHVLNLEGGLDAYAEVDGSVPKY